MKALLGMLPFAVALAVAAAVIALLMERNATAGRLALAGLLAGHGLVHVLFFVPQPAPAADAATAPEWPFDIARTWAATSFGVDPAVVRVLGVALVAIVVVGFVMAAFSTIGLLLPVEWWRPLVGIGAVASLLTLALFFNPQLLLGPTIDVVLLVVAVASTWSPATA